jgi:hypothetical protein
VRGDHHCVVNRKQVLQLVLQPNQEYLAVNQSASCVAATSTGRHQILQAEFTGNHTTVHC